MVALEKFEAGRQKSASRSPSIYPTSPSLKPHSPEPTSSRASPSPSKLRYAAYEPPRPTHRLRRVSSGSSRHSDDGSTRSFSHGRAYEDPMTLTVTAGDLTLAAQTSDLRSISSVSGYPCLLEGETGPDSSTVGFSTCQTIAPACCANTGRREFGMYHAHMAVYLTC